VIDALNKSRTEIYDGLKNKTQQLMFNKVANRRFETVMGQVDSHAARQLNVYNIGETTARADAATKDAVVYSGTWKDAGVVDDKDPSNNKPAGPYQQYLNTALSEAKNAAIMSGLPPESDQMKALMMAVHTKVADGVVRSMVAGNNPIEAREYLDAAIKAKKIDPISIDNLQGLVKTAGVKDESLRISMAMTGNLPEQTAAINKMFLEGKVSAETRDAVVSRVEHSFALMNAQENDVNKEKMGAYQEWIMKNKGKPIISAPSELYAWAKKEGQLAGLDGFSKRDGQATGDRRSELINRGRMLNLAGSDPAAFVKEFQSTGFVNKMDLGSAGIKEMQNIALSIIDNKGKYKTQFDPKVLQDAIPGALLKSGKRDEKDAFVAIMSEETAKWIAANPGKDPDPKAYSQVTSAANAKWVHVGKVWNDEKTAAEVRASGDLKAVPKDFFDAMKKRGASDDEALSAWVLKNKKGTK
jgi:hypothetical protein